MIISFFTTILLGEGCTTTQNPLESLNDSVITTSGPGAGKPCIFPFLYKATVYNECTDIDNSGVEWCSTKVFDIGTHIDGNFGNCGNACNSGKFLYWFFNLQLGCKIIQVLAFTPYEMALFKWAWEA